MHHRILLVLASIIAVGVLLFTQGDIDNPSDRLKNGLSAYLPPECLEDARLRRSITLDVSALPISEVLDKLQDHSGVAFSVAREVGSLRVCVHVQQMPLLELMASLAGVLDLTWRPVEKGEKGYELYQTAQQRARLLGQAQRRTQESAKAILDAMLEAGYQIASGEVLPAIPQQKEGGVDAVSALAQALKREPVILGTLSTLPPQRLIQLFQGEPQRILGSQLPPEVRQMLAGRLPSNAEGEQPPVWVEIRPDAITRSMMFSVRRGNAEWGTGIPSLFETEEYQREFERATDLLDEKTGQRAVRAEKPLSLPRAIALLAQVTKLNIVAEYYPLTMYDRVVLGGDARAILKQLCAPRLYSAQRVGNTLWLSASYRAEHRQIDIPDPTLKRWFTSKDEFGITTEIALEIARLSYAQQRALGLWSSQQRTLDGVSPAKREVYLQLQNLTGRSVTSVLMRLLASLPSPLRTRVLNGSSLPLRDLPLSDNTILLEFASYLPPEMQVLLFDTDTPCWLEIRRSVDMLWATEEKDTVQRSSSPPRQSPQKPQTSYRLRVERVEVYLRTPSGSSRLSEWEWYRFKRP